MRRSSLALPLAYGAILVAACAEDRTSAIALGMTVPQGLLDEATAVQLEVIPGTASCNTGNGRVSGTFDKDDVESFNLQREGCAAGATWCRDITLERDGEPRVFSVVATAAGSVLGRGCAKVPIDKDPVEVKVTIVAELPDRCCNDGVVQLGEQCDTGVPAPFDCAGNPVEEVSGSCGGLIPDPACECDCLAKEIHVSPQGSAPNLSPNLKTDVALAFAGGSGAQANMLRAVFADGDATTPEINWRVLDASLYPAPPPFSQQLRVPMAASCANPAQGFTRPLEQIQPDVARVNDTLTAVVWADTSTTPGFPKAFGTWINNQGCTDIQPLALTASTTASIAHPQVAGGPSGTVLVVWAEGTTIRGRVWSPSTGALVPGANDIDIATQINGARPRVAGNAGGWVVTYTGTANGGDVNFKTVSPAGIVGPEQRANIVVDGPQDQPDVAMLPDGSFAVIWRTGNGIALQRYDQAGTAISGDQDQVVSATSGPGERPRIAASLDGGSFYAAGWTIPGQVWGRMVDGAGALYHRNHVNGLLSDFLVNHPAIASERFDLAIAIGQQRAVYAWTAIFGDPTIFLRGFPLPE
jgi:hypothetical protein